MITQAIGTDMLAYDNEQYVISEIKYYPGEKTLFEQF